MHCLRSTGVAATAALLASCATITPPDLSGMSFSDEPLVGKAVWHDLVTNDLDAAKRFYGGLFGWNLETSRTGRGQDYVLARDGDVYVAGLLQAAPRADGANVSRWLPYLSVGDVDTAVRRATSAGGEVIVAPRNVPLGRVAAIADDQGAIIGLARSNVGDPDDATTAGAVGRVVWNELVAEDSVEAARFYERVFGYRASEIERRGGRYVLLAASGADRAGILQEPAPEWPAVWLTYFGVADPVAAAAAAENLGGKVLLAPSAELRDGTIAVVEDPAGAVLVLQQWPK